MQLIINMVWVTQTHKQTFQKYINDSISYRFKRTHTKYMNTRNLFSFSFFLVVANSIRRAWFAAEIKNKTLIYVCQWKSDFAIFLVFRIGNWSSILLQKLWEKNCAPLSLCQPQSCPVGYEAQFESTAVIAFRSNRPKQYIPNTVKMLLFLGSEDPLTIKFGSISNFRSSPRTHNHSWAEFRCTILCMIHCRRKNYNL